MKKLSKMFSYINTIWGLKKARKREKIVVENFPEIKRCIIIKGVDKLYILS